MDSAGEHLSLVHHVALPVLIRRSGSFNTHQEHTDASSIPCHCFPGVGRVDIEYSPNAGAGWSLVALNTLNDGDFSWTVPNTPSDECLVRVMEAGDHGPGDTSDAVFVIGTPVDAVRGSLATLCSRRGLLGLSRLNGGFVGIRYAVDEPATVMCSVWGVDGVLKGRARIAAQAPGVHTFMLPARQADVISVVRLSIGEHTEQRVLGLVH